MPFFLTIALCGESLDDDQELIQGRKDSTALTDRGKNQASALGATLAEEGEKFTQIFCSDLSRATQTVSCMTDQLKKKMDVPLITQTPVLRERDHGSWEGKSMTSGPYADKIKQMKLGPHEHHKVEVPQGETYQEARQRAMNFFKDEILKLADVTAMDATDRVLIVMHRCLFLCFLDELASLDKEFTLQNFDAKQIGKVKVEDTARTRFKIGKRGDGGKRTLDFTHVFDTKHFEAMPQFENAKPHVYEMPEPATFGG